MASQQSIADYIVEQLAGTGLVPRESSASSELSTKANRWRSFATISFMSSRPERAAPSLAIALKGGPIPAPSRIFKFRQSAGRIPEWLTKLMHKS